MKKVFLFFVCASSLAIAQAQVQFGVKAGANLSGITGDNEGLESKIGFNAGVFAEIPVATKFSVKPEAVLSFSRCKI